MQLNTKTAAVFLYLLASCLWASSQNFTFFGERTYGTNKSELQARSIVRISDNRILLCGQSLGYMNGDKTDPYCDSSIYVGSDIWLVMIDTTLNIVWDKSIGGSNDEAQPSAVFIKNKIIVSCSSESNISCEKSENTRDTSGTHPDYWICVLDTSGNKLWDKTLGGFKNELSPKLIEFPSGNLIVCGVSQSDIGGDKSDTNFAPGNIAFDYWAVKLDSIGNKIWDHSFGGTGQEEFYSNSLDYADRFSLLALDNDNFLIAGTTGSAASGTISDSSRGGEDIWIIKIDSLGSKVWDKRYGGASLDRCNKIIQYDNNGFILCGLTSSPQGGDITDSTRGGTDCWIIRLDAMGNKLWDKRYGGNKGEEACWIERAPGGGYWVSGYSNSDVGYEVSDPPIFTPYPDYWIFKIDNAGNKLWDKRFGGNKSDYGSKFVIMPDSSIFLLGTSDSATSVMKSFPGNGSFDYWVVHIKYTDILAGSNSIQSVNIFSVFPNPANDAITVSFALQPAPGSVISISEITGRIIFEQPIDPAERKVTLDVSNYTSGIYFIKVNNTVRKFVKE